MGHLCGHLARFSRHLKWWCESTLGTVVHHLDSSLAFSGFLLAVLFQVKHWQFVVCRSFNDKPINENQVGPIGKVLFEQEQNDLLDDLKDIPRKACDRKVRAPQGMVIFTAWSDLNLIWLIFFCGCVEWADQWVCEACKSSQNPPCESFPKPSPCNFVEDICLVV